MRKLIRPTYPAQFSLGLLVLIFVVTSLLSLLIFDVRFHDLDKNRSIYVGMVLVGAAVIIMLLIIWEEILFPIKVKEIKGGMIFRNHRTKLKTQVLFYCCIPAIFTFIYLEYEVILIRFIVCAGICIISPVLEKIASGINNYNDFLKLTIEKIEFKDNEKEGSFEIKDLKKIRIVKDERNTMQNIQLLLINNKLITIHLDNMELDAFYVHIYKFITTHYTGLLDETKMSVQS